MGLPNVYDHPDFRLPLISAQPQQVIALCKRQVADECEDGADDCGCNDCDKAGTDRFEIAVVSMTSRNRHHM
ncbi:MAG: hypothetical protein ACI32N_04080, partial [Bulleidia sp.]